MRACKLVLIVMLLTLPVRALSAPPTEPGDEEIFRIVREKGYEALNPEQWKRFAFWVVYQSRITAMNRMHNGALVAENFNAPELSLSVREEVTSEGKKQVPLGGEWRIWNSDPQIEITQENGLLSIKGTSSRAGGLNFNGIVGKTYGNTDVVAIVEMKPVAPKLDHPGFHVAMFHLCGSFPDIFNELTFGRERDGSIGWAHHYVGESETHKSEFPLLAPSGDEHDRFYEIKLEHVADTERSRAWLKVDGRWKEIGEAREVLMSTAKVELKINAPSKDAEIECYFDNCRVYPRPETHPVRFVVFASHLGKTEVEGIKLDLLLNGAAEPTATGLTDRFGRLSLTLPSDVDYPAAARVRVTLTDGSRWEREIEQHDVGGLYPDSVWVIRVNAREIAGDDTWWEEIPQGRKE